MVNDSNVNKVKLKLAFEALDHNRMYTILPWLPAWWTTFLYWTTITTICTYKYIFIY